MLSFSCRRGIGIHAGVTTHDNVRRDEATRALGAAGVGAAAGRSGSEDVPPRSPQEWLNADEACDYLRIPSRKALYQAIRRGQVPAHRLGRRMRFSRSELDRLLRGELGR
jgi:excisionase family DNA binding protein